MGANELEKLSVEELIDAIQKLGYFVEKTPVVSGRKFKLDLGRWKGGKIRFGAVSDTHLGSRWQQLTSLHEFYSICKRRGIETVLNCGDLMDGESVYRGHVYELFVHGADAQVKYVVDNYPKIKGIKTLVIGGNHDQSFIKVAGVDVVAGVSGEREDIEFLGNNLAYLGVGGITIALMHGSGANAYARSYKLQKIVEQLASENKPEFLFLGHYHCSVIITYRNVEGIQMPCFQAQTPYLTAKGLMPVVAGLIVEAQLDDAGLASVKYEWIPFFKMRERDF